MNYENIFSYENSISLELHLKFQRYLFELVENIAQNYFGGQIFIAN